MKRERYRLFCNDMSKLSELGFVREISSYHANVYWRKERMCITEEGFITVYAPTSATVMTLIEMGKMGLIERVLIEEKPKEARQIKVVAKIEESEYREFLEWKDKQHKHD